MFTWIAELSHLPPSIQTILVIGGLLIALVILLVVAFYAPAGERLVRFIASILALFTGREHGSTNMTSPFDEHREDHQR